MSDRYITKSMNYEYLPYELTQYRVTHRSTGTYIDIKEHGGSEEVTETTVVSEQVSVRETEWYRNQEDGLAYWDDVLVVFKGSSNGVDHLKIKEGTHTIVSDACAFLKRTEIDIPDSVNKIGKDAFKYVPNINYHGNAMGSPWGAKCVNGCIEGDFVFSDKTKTKVVGYIGSETAITIPKGVKEIGAKAFELNTDLQSVDIPETVEIIGDSAFCWCRKLSNVSIPNSVMVIGNCAFEYCSDLQDIKIPNGVLEIGEGAFKDCDDLISIDIPDSVMEIGENAFKGVPFINYKGNAMGSPWGAKCINGCIEDGFVFSDKTKSKVVGHIGSETAITIPKGVKEIGANAFELNKYLQSIDISETVEIIGDSAFYSCKMLSSVSIPNSVKKIGNCAFKYCSALEDIRIPNGVLEIGKEAFYDCNGLTSIDIPDSVMKIGPNVFNGCKRLTIIIPHGTLVKFVKLLSQYKYEFMRGKAPWLKEI